MGEKPKSQSTISYRISKAEFGEAVADLRLATKAVRDLMDEVGCIPRLVNSVVEMAATLAKNIPIGANPVAAGGNTILPSGAATEVDEGEEGEPDANEVSEQWDLTTMNEIGA